MHQIQSSEWLLQPLEEWSESKLGPLLLAVFVSANPLMVLSYGIGIGSSALSFVLLIVPLLGLLAVGSYRHTLLDSLFVLFIGCVAVSTAINGPGAAKEEALLLVSLAAYPAARRGAGANHFLFLWIGIVAAVGVTSTAVALVQQWNDPHGKPLVFGRYDAAPAQFFICIAVLLFGIVAANLAKATTAILLAVSSLPLVILSASIVRFSFAALVATLFLEGILSKSHRLKALAAALIVLGAGIGGELMRHETAMKMSAVPLMLPSTPTDQPCSEVNETSSISIRLRLIKDALQTIPHAGLWGSGLGSFAAATCMGMSPHVTLFQIIMEFGWLAAFLALAIFLGALYRTYWMERPEARFAFMGMVFVSLLTLAHGDFARNGLFFLFLGYLVRISEDPL